LQQSWNRWNWRLRRCAHLEKHKVADPAIEAAFTYQGPHKWGPFLEIRIPHPINGGLSPHKRGPFTP
jgi:hypothetical protein